MNNLRTILQVETKNSDLGNEWFPFCFPVHDPESTSTKNPVQLSYQIDIKSYISNHVTNHVTSNHILTLQVAL